MNFVKEIFADYESLLDKEVKLGGWVKSVRTGKNDQIRKQRGAVLESFV